MYRYTWLYTVCVLCVLYIILFNLLFYSIVMSNFQSTICNQKQEFYRLVKNFFCQIFIPRNYIIITTKIMWNYLLVSALS